MFTQAWENTSTAHLAKVAAIIQNMQRDTALSAASHRVTSEQVSNALNFLDAIHTVMAYATPRGALDSDQLLASRSQVRHVLADILKLAFEPNGNDTDAVHKTARSVTSAVRVSSGKADDSLNNALRLVFNTFMSENSRTDWYQCKRYIEPRDQEALKNYLDAFPKHTASRGWSIV